MSNLIKVKNSSYSKYEELLLRRDKLKKDAFNYSMDYIKEFGDKTLKVYKKQIACIKIKKEIYYCQTILNQGGKLKQSELNKYIKKEMKKYKEELNKMIEENESAKNSTIISQSDLLEIKKIYRKIAKNLHPDINPKTKDSKDLLDLWNRVVIAYNCNNLNEIETLEVLVNKALEELKLGKMEIEIPNIEEKIVELESEINKIITTDPYLYKDILEDKEKVKELKKDFDEEYLDYKSYERELKSILDNVKKIVGVFNEKWINKN